LKLKTIFFALIFGMTGLGTAVSQTLPFTILHTNDEHSHLIPIPAADHHSERENPALGGFARLAGAVDEIRREKSETGEPVLLFSGGDILGGPAFGWMPLMEGEAPELSLMQKIRYDAVTIGNHEFDYGADQYATYLSEAGYPEASETTVILGTNTRPPQDHPLSEMGIQHHILKELDNGLVVGVFGLIGDDAISKTAHPGPVNFDDPIASAERAVEELREAGADVIVSVNHSGVAEDRELARRVEGIHVIVGGHSHTPLYEPITENGTVIVQAGRYLNYLGVLELEWDPESEQVFVRNNEKPFLKPLDFTVPEDEGIAAEVFRYRELLNEWVTNLTGGNVTSIEQSVARSEFAITRHEPRKESALGNYITDALKAAAESALQRPVDVAVQANGAIRSDIVPGTQPWSEGEITFYDLVMSSGLGSGDDGSPGYPMVSFYVTEDEIRRALEVSVLLSELMDDSYFLQFSGLRKMYDPNRAVLMTIPVTDTPIPTSRAVLRAERELENGDVQRIRKGSEELVHVVTDYYIAGFLPMVGDVVPNLAIELRNEHGDPVDLDETIIQTENGELKVWQALLQYVQSHEPGNDGLPVIPQRYAEPEGRMVITYTLPLWIWPVAAVLFILTAIILIILKRR
jgi:5'-nucleotidase / UDP-sugar diphosphatase